MKYLYTLVLLISTLILASCNAQKPEGVKQISLYNLKQEVIGKDVQFIDVRTAKEYIKHIDDAVNIDLANKKNFKYQVQQLNKNKPVYLYCYSGVRSRKASKILSKMGFKYIFDFSGGWKAWQQQ